MSWRISSPPWRASPKPSNSTSGIVAIIRSMPSSVNGTASRAIHSSMVGCMGVSRRNSGAGATVGDYSESPDIEHDNRRRLFDQCLESLIGVGHRENVMPHRESRLRRISSRVRPLRMLRRRSISSADRVESRPAGGSPCVSPSGRKNPITLPSPSHSSTACVALPSRRHVSWSSVKRTAKRSPAEHEVHPSQNRSANGTSASAGRADRS